MEAYKQRAMAGSADRELQFGPGRRLIEKQLLNNNNNNNNRQLQATATPVPANAHWKINGLVVSHIFMYLNLPVIVAFSSNWCCTLQPYFSYMLVFYIC
jgi:hypothetical protein